RHPRHDAGQLPEERRGLFRTGQGGDGPVPHAPHAQLLPRRAPFRPARRREAHAEPRPWTAPGPRQSPAARLGPRRRPPGCTYVTGDARMSLAANQGRGRPWIEIAPVALLAASAGLALVLVGVSRPGWSNAATTYALAGGLAAVLAGLVWSVIRQGGAIALLS